LGASWENMLANFKSGPEKTNYGYKKLQGHEFYVTIIDYQVEGVVVIVFIFEICLVFYYWDFSWYLLFHLC
jgi:hypothetical protein